MRGRVVAFHSAVITASTSAKPPTARSWTSAIASAKLRPFRTNRILIWQTAQVSSTARVVEYPSCVQTWSVVAAAGRGRVVPRLRRTFATIYFTSFRDRGPGLPDQERSREELQLSTSRLKKRGCHKPVMKTCVHRGEVKIPVFSETQSLGASRIVENSKTKRTRSFLLSINTPEQRL